MGAQKNRIPAIPDNGMTNRIMDRDRTPQMVHAITSGVFYFNL
jgi:hypothetical protein